MNEAEKLMYELSGMLMANEQKEAEAVSGYNAQLRLIAAVREATGEEYAEFLDKLETATKEKIQDELNHGESLYEEYVTMTGISPAKE